MTKTLKETAKKTPTKSVKAEVAAAMTAALEAAPADDQPKASKSVVPLEHKKRYGKA